MPGKSSVRNASYLFPLLRRECVLPELCPDAMARYLASRYWHRGYKKWQVIGIDLAQAPGVHQPKIQPGYAISKPLASDEIFKGCNFRRRIRQACQYLEFRHTYPKYTCKKSRNLVSCFFVKNVPPHSFSLQSVMFKKGPQLESIPLNCHQNAVSAPPDNGIFIYTCLGG